MADTPTNPAPVDPDAGIPTSEATLAGVIAVSSPDSAKEPVPCSKCHGTPRYNYDCPDCLGTGEVIEPTGWRESRIMDRRKEVDFLERMQGDCDYRSHRRLPGVSTTGPVPRIQCATCLMENEGWGPGNAAATLPAFRKVTIGNIQAELIHGDYPHSRQYNATYIRLPSGSVEGFNGHYVCWGVQIETRNYLKTSGLSGNEVRKGGSIKLTVDGAVVAEAFCREFGAALDEAKRLYWAVQNALECGMPAYWTPEGRAEIDNGKLIFFRGFPGSTRHVMADQGCVMLVPEPGFSFPGFLRTPYEPSGEIKWPLYSEEISWHRKPGQLSTVEGAVPLTRERIIQLMFPDTEPVTEPQA